MNVIDRLISTVSPQKGIKRAVARAKLNILNSGYGNHGANAHKKSLLGWIYGGGSPQEDINENLSILRQRSRDLYMGGAPIATGAIKTMRTNVTGSGLRIKPSIDGEALGLSDEEAYELERTIELEFSLWAESVECDAERRNNFYELQQLALLSQLLSGEVFTLLPSFKRSNTVYDLRVQLVEADRCRTPTERYFDENIKDGIELGTHGEARAYYFSEKHPLSNEYENHWKYKRIPAYGKFTNMPNVIHLMESERPGQTRGVPFLAPVIETLKQLGRYTNAELVAAVVSAFYTVFIESDSEELDMTQPMLGESIPEEMQVDGADEHSFELGSGSVVALAPGDHVKEANPNRPNVAFDGFVSAMCRQIGTALEIPYEVLMKQFNSSYSASRAALIEAGKMFMMRRTWLAAKFCQPIYEQWLAEAVAKNRINAPGFLTDPILRKIYCSAEWFGPSQGQLDPLKEVVAAAKKVEEGFSTRQKETIGLTGYDYVKNVRALQKEEKLLQKVRGEQNAED